VNEKNENQTVWELAKEYLRAPEEISVTLFWLYAAIYKIRKEQGETLIKS
jgi:hypothetical protein